IRQISVPFHGVELMLVEHDGQPYTPMKPLVEGMGLAWQPQHRKLGEDRFSSCVTEMVMQLPGDSQRRSVTCMSLRKLPGWLMTMEPNKIKNPEVRARVIQYQNECDDVLWQYWNEGIAVNPRIAFTVNPDDVLTADQQETLRLMVNTFAERLPKDRQGPATIKAWSKLKAHFKVKYRQIPRSEFTEAVSIVARTAAEWEVVEEQPTDLRTVKENVHALCSDVLWIRSWWGMFGEALFSLTPEVASQVNDHIVGGAGSARLLSSFTGRGIDEKLIKTYPWRADSYARNRHMTVGQPG
ncbi:MAG: phage antirepressor N-terminal domain-containing protein, partial [Burkholderia gladioli]